MTLISFRRSLEHAAPFFKFIGCLDDGSRLVYASWSCVPAMLMISFSDYLQTIEELLSAGETVVSWCMVCGIGYPSE